jgi:hypothetical protein
MLRNTFLHPCLVLALTAVLGSLLLSSSSNAEEAKQIIPAATQAIGTAFSYQGHLTDNNAPATGKYDFLFKLYDSLTDGQQIGLALDLNDESVNAGLFTVQLDFGDGVFTGPVRYLEIGVRPGASTAPHTFLTPRRAITPAPYALGLRPGATIFADGGFAIKGESISGDGIQGSSHASYRSGVFGVTDADSGFGVHGRSNNAKGYAGYFEGNVNIMGTLVVTGAVQFSAQKACSIVTMGNWRDTILVPSSWTASQCDNFKKTFNAQQYQLICILDSGFSAGALDGGIPSPNCGW